MNSTYFCPMHPEITSDEPSSCPLCGMALEGDDATSDDTTEQHALILRLWVCAPVLVLNMLSMGWDLLAAPQLHFTNHPWWSWFQTGLSSMVVLWGGSIFFQRAWESLRNRSANMFTLIGMGVGIAYLYSLVVWVLQTQFPALALKSTQWPLYYDAAVAIVTLTLIGQLLELRARKATGSSIAALFEVLPAYASRITADGGTESVHHCQIQAGDRLRVINGEKVAADGIIESGECELEMSLLTGEPLPVFKQAGDAVPAGTLNVRGEFVMKVERPGSESILAQLGEMLSQIRRSRIPIQRLADCASAWLVPLVLLTALSTFVGWWMLGGSSGLSNGILHAVAVLVIACPCALGLASPMSVTVISGKAARSGVLFKNAEAIERLYKTKTLLLDKTGTLTVGRPQLDRIHTKYDWSGQTLLQYAASMAAHSIHPIAKALVKASEERHLPLLEIEGFVEHTGAGMSGKIGGQLILCGNVKLLKEQAGEKAEQEFLDTPQEGKTTVGSTRIALWIKDQLAGWLTVIDPIKGEAAVVLQTLRKSGLTTTICSGDTYEASSAVAAFLGVKQVIAPCAPAEKLAAVEELQSQGAYVAVVGDGINDAAAMEKADIAIAMDTGAEAAIRSADISLLHGDLWGLLRARMLSKAAIRNIRQNLALAFIYNLASIPLAAGAFEYWLNWSISPMWAAAAMSLSSVSVIGNALRLKNLRLP